MTQQIQLRNLKILQSNKQNIFCMTTTSTNPNKPFTGNFQLQTKIRVIIQEVLAATMRKLSVFNQKIDKFDDYFMIFKERVDGIQQIGSQNKSSVQKSHDNIYKLRSQFNSQNIKNDEINQKNKIMLHEFKDQIQQMTKTIKNIQRQNENLNNELSKTKGKFLQYSNIISALKEQVSWKITKYVEETAETNTQIKISNQQMKKMYFQIGLNMQKQKQKYQQIIMMNENHQNNNKRTLQAIDQLNQQNEKRIQENKKALQKIDEYDTFMQSKLKGVENKTNFRIDQLEKDNKKIMTSVKKLDDFNKELQKMKQHFQLTNQNMIKKIQDNNKKLVQGQQTQIIKLNKEILRIEKTLQKKLNQSIQKQQKAQDFLTQKIQFIKMQIQNEVSSKTSQLLQEKEKNNQVNSSTMDEVNTKINKFNLQMHKNITKVQNQIKQTKTQLKKAIQEINDVIQIRIQQTLEKGSRGRKFSGEDGGTSISPQIAQQLNNLQNKFQEIDLNLQRNQKQIKELVDYKEQQIKFKSEMIANINNHFSDQEERISRKVQKIMFLITKMRGDGIIRNQFTDKQIKQLKKNYIQTKQYTDTLLKLQPAIGQCINLILSLVFDAQFQHSKIIQDNLPLLKKDQEKFKTCVEGILYEYKEKKKPNMICYRHKDVKKTDIIKSTFNAFITLWEQLFQNQYKDKNHLFPKNFYKKYVQKTYSRVPQGQKGQNGPNNKSLKKISPGKNSKQGFSIGTVLPGATQSFQELIGYENYNKGLQNKPNKNLTEEKQQEDIVNPLIEANNMNSSFRVGKRKTLKKDQILVINQNKDRLVNMNIVNIQP